MEKIKTKHFTIHNRIEELPILADKIDLLSQDWELSQTQVMNLNLVLEEALSNIIYYAYKEEGNHKIKISLTLHNQTLVVRIADSGVPFDPTQRQEPDITLPAEMRPIGGLGIFLITKIMDSVRYDRKNNQNILILTKNI